MYLQSVLLENRTMTPFGGPRPYPYHSTPGLFGVLFYQPDSLSRGVSLSKNRKIYRAGWCDTSSVWGRWSEVASDTTPQEHEGCLHERGVPLARLVVTGQLK